MGALLDQLQITHDAYVASLKNLREQHIASLKNNRQDNPKVNRISENPMIFTISSSGLQNTWDPFYHDFLMQYDFLIAKAENPAISFERHIEKLQNMQDTGKYDDKRLHPDVIKQVLSLL